MHLNIFGSKVLSFDNWKTNFYKYKNSILQAEELMFMILSLFNTHYLALFSNRVKPGTVLIEIVLTGDPLYFLFFIPSSKFNLMYLMKILITPASWVPRPLACCSDLGDLKNHNFLPWGCSSNLTGPTTWFLRLLRNFY